MSEESTQSNGGTASTRLAALTETVDRAVAEPTAVAERAPPWRDRLTALASRWLPDFSRFTVARPVVFGVLAVGVLVVALLVIVLFGNRSEAEPPPRLEAAGVAGASSAASATGSVEPSELVVSVVGKVSEPGLVTVSASARVADAVAEAGGARHGTNLYALNLARKVSDGEQIYVGVPVPPEAAAESDVDSGASEGGSGKVDLNTATLEQLETLNGVGPVTAESILDWREENERFTAVEQLREVDGIGEVRLEKLRDEVVVQ
ncbi:competence protein ComEA [Tamaricihabitans halophyticus]|uniref:Competence protein ComEA n=1 Tax=Tamaricihabitans halophyticus TaxID=1262583 RepID=A0A4R2QXH6_9PSEU|nr:helix-hairpin-helix domain-containing protein [Tamaricihabitans halophyticus]TCP54853.1 competence protein ComEA [Tamaricihabitans halophyticus]